ncbi:hypothetical protein Vretimale_15674 [Volvox reticuliferus]|uniref:C2H2-type domain-containing protein n=2 Tax=Volvox reticuliferus TaxID=1737510 RepID=A0A8J4LWJ8_9CHLO|nr:hypothetical protein Vretimale_15674 [Volvox reticuliferus]
MDTDSDVEEWGGVGPGDPSPSSPVIKGFTLRRRGVWMCNKCRAEVFRVRDAHRHLRANHSRCAPDDSEEDWEGDDVHQDTPSPVASGSEGHDGGDGHTPGDGLGDVDMEDLPEDIPLPADFDSDDEIFRPAGAVHPGQGAHLGPHSNDGIADAGLPEEVENLGAGDLPGGDDGDASSSDDDEVDILHFVAELAADEWAEQGPAGHVGATGEPDTPRSPESEDGGVQIRTCECGCDLPYIRPRTYEFFKAHLDKPLWVFYDPVFPTRPLYSCPWTLRQTVNALLGHIKEHGPRREELESVLRLYSATLPPRHLCPDSLYMLIRLTGAKRWDEYEYHVCSSAECTGHVYGKAEAAPSVECCPKCALPRFKIVSIGGKDVREPSNWFIYFGIEEVIRSQFFANPEFCRQRGKFRGAGAPGSSMWKGAWVQRLQQYNSGIALSPDSSIYDIGIDWITPYNSTQHSVGVIFLRCADVNPRDKGKRWNQHVIGIIPGPKMPENLSPYMELIVQDLLRLCRQGMVVTEAATAAAAVVTGDAGAQMAAGVAAATVAGTDPGGPPFAVATGDPAAAAAVAAAQGVPARRRRRDGPGGDVAAITAGAGMVPPMQVAGDGAAPAHMPAAGVVMQVPAVGAGTAPVMVQGAGSGTTGTGAGRTFLHRVFLGVVLCDTPARCKVCNGNGQNSYSGACTWCLFQGSLRANTGRGATVRYYGYVRPVRHDIADRVSGRSFRVGDVALGLTDALLRSRSKLARKVLWLHLHGDQAGRKLTKADFKGMCRRLGCKGPNPFDRLPYCDLSCLFPVPIGHALLFGVVSDFVDFLLRPLKDLHGDDPNYDLATTRDARHLVAARGSCVLVTSDFGRRYKCILAYRASYRMEDWLHFVETFSLYIFKGDVLPERVRGLWWLLVDVVSHYFRPRPADETHEQFLAASGVAADKLLQYAKALEELKVPDNMFTINLHICVCRLREQEVQLGSASAFTDLPVERVMQDMKSEGGRRVAQVPEKHYAQWLCIVRQAESLTVPDPSGATLTTNQQLAAFLNRRTADHSGPQYDSKGGVGYCIGVGHNICNELGRLQQVRRAVGGLIQYYAESLPAVQSWAVPSGDGYIPNDDLINQVLLPEPPGNPKARYFLRAEAPDEVQYFSAEYGRQLKRCSNWALYTAEEQEPSGRLVTRSYVAFLKYFVHLPVYGDGVSTRFAVADVYSAEVHSGNLLVVNMDRARTGPSAGKWEMWHDLGVPIQELKGKFCVAAPSGDRRGYMYFMPYAHYSDR